MIRIDKFNANDKNMSHNSVGRNVNGIKKILTTSQLSTYLHGPNQISKVFLEE